MLRKCKTETTSEKLEDGITVTHSFSQRAANALQALGGMDCAYHLGFQDCQFETCRIGEIGTRMQKAGCTSLFLFQDYKDWYGCKKEDGKPQDKKVQDACWCAALRRAHATLHTYFMRTCNVDVDTCVRLTGTGVYTARVLTVHVIGAARMAGRMAGSSSSTSRALVLAAATTKSQRFWRKLRLIKPGPSAKRLSMIKM